MTLKDAFDELLSPPYKETSTSFTVSISETKRKQFRNLIIGNSKRETFIKESFSKFCEWQKRTTGIEIPESFQPIFARALFRFYKDNPSLVILSMEGRGERRQLVNIKGLDYLLSWRDNIGYSEEIETVAFTRVKLWSEVQKERELMLKKLRQARSSIV